MYPVEAGSPVRYTPPAPATTTPYTVQQHDTVQSVAHAYNVTPEELARTNNISVTTVLTPGQTLILPANAVQPPKNEQPPKAPTPAQTTDAAIAAYDAAVNQRNTDMKNAPHNAAMHSEIWQDDSATVDSTQQAMNTAIQNEIAGEIANRNSNVPAQFRTPTDQLITSFGQAIAQRHQGDPTAQAAISTAVSAYQLQSKADALIPTFSGNVSPQAKLQTLGSNLQGQSQDVVDQVLSNPTVQSWINAAAAQVAQPYANVNADSVYYAQDQAAQATDELATITNGLPPALAIAVTQASMPTINKVAQLELSGAGCMVPFDNVQSVLAGLGNSDQANAVIAQVADAYASSPSAVMLTHGGATSQLESSILDSPGYGAAGNPAFAIALGNALQARGETSAATNAFAAGAQGVQDYLATNGGSPLQAYNAAHSAATETEQKLAELLSQSGPLTYQQRQAFISAYQNDPDNAKVYQAEDTAAKNLAAYMQTNQTSLLYAAGRNPGAAQQLYGMMQDLAQSGQGVTALQFAGYVNGNSGAAQAFSKFSDYQSTFMPTAVAAAQGQLLAQDNGDTKSAVLSLLDMADPIFRGKDGWSDIKEGLEHLAEGDTKAFNASEFAEAYTKLGAGGKAWAVCAVMVSSINGANADQVNSMIYAFADAGGNVAEVGTGALQALADAGKFGAFSDSTKALAAFGAKLVPGLSVVANTAAFAHDFDAAKNGNPADALALLGDMDAVVGSVMTAFGAEVPGEVVTAIGVLSAAPFEFVGGIIEHFESQQEFQDEQVKYLKAAGLDDNSAELMAKDGSEINAFANQLGLSPSDAQQVLVDHPEAFGQGPGYTQGVTDVVKACQIKPQDVDGFLNALAKDNPNYVSMFFGVRSAENPAMPLANSANLVDLIGGGNYANAKAFIQSHAPEVFSAAGTAQRQADCDYENALSAGGSQQQQIGNLLKSNQSPAYQAEIIKVMKDNGTLNTWVQQMSNQYAFNGWPQAAASAIQNAQSAGVLSASQAQQYLGQLG